MTDLYKLREAVSKILCCPKKYVIIRGIEKCNSLWITFMIPDWCTDILMCLSIKSWTVLDELTVNRIFIKSVKKEIVCPFNIPGSVSYNIKTTNNLIKGVNILHVYNITVYW